MNKEIETKIAEIVSALGAEPAQGTSGIICGDFVANGVQYSFNVISLTKIYPYEGEAGLLLSIGINGKEPIFMGFYKSTQEIVNTLLSSNI